MLSRSNSASLAYRCRKHGIQCNAAVCECLLAYSARSTICAYCGYRYNPSTEGFPAHQQQQQPQQQQHLRGSTQIVYPIGTFPAQPRPSKATLRPQSHQSYAPWPFNGTTIKQYVLKHRSSHLGEARSQPADIPSSRPVSMTVQSMRDLGMQNARLLPRASFDGGER